MLGLLSTAAAVVVALTFESLAREIVLEEAARRGIRLEPRDVTVEWGRVAIWEARVRLDGVADLELVVDAIEVRMVGLRPVSAVARGVRGRAATPDALAQVLAFGRLRAEGLIPTTATQIELSLGGERPPGSAVVSLRATEGTLRPKEPARLRGVLVDVPRPRLRLGPLDLVASADGATLEVGLGDDLESAALRVTADVDARRAVVSMKRAPIATIAASLGRRAAPGEPPWPGDFAVESVVRVEWTADPRGDLTGTLDATAFGLVPPHPAELAGIVFGNDTKVALSFRAGPKSEAVALETLSVAVGSLRLQGTGTVAPRGESFVAQASLRGPIACSQLVGSVAVARLGLPLGAGLGAIAQQAIGGSVDLRLDVRVDGDRLASPEVRPSASIHCRLSLFGG